MQHEQKAASYSTQLHRFLAHSSTYIPAQTAEAPCVGQYTAAYKCHQQVHGLLLDPDHAFMPLSILIHNDRAVLTRQDCLPDVSSIASKP